MFTDVNETKLKELEICPILTQHFVYPFTNHVEPTLVVKILTQNVIVLLDTGAHVSVLPKKLITDQFLYLKRPTPRDMLKSLVVRR